MQKRSKIKANNLKLNAKKGKYTRGQNCAQNDRSLLHVSHLKPVDPATYLTKDVPDYEHWMRAAVQPVDPKAYLAPDYKKQHLHALPSNHTMSAADQLNMQPKVVLLKNWRVTPVSDDEEPEEATHVEEIHPSKLDLDRLSLAPEPEKPKSFVGDAATLPRRRRTGLRGRRLGLQARSSPSDSAAAAPAADDTVSIGNAPSTEGPVPGVGLPPVGRLPDGPDPPLSERSADVGASGDDVRDAAPPPGGNTVPPQASVAGGPVVGSPRGTDPVLTTDNKAAPASDVDQDSSTPTPSPNQSPVPQPRYALRPRKDGAAPAQ